MSRLVQFNDTTNPDGTKWYPDDIGLFSDTKPHPQDNTKQVATYYGSDLGIADFDGYFPSKETLNFRDFMRLFGATVYNQIIAEYNAGTDINLNWFLDLAKAPPATIQLSSPDTESGLNILVANANIDFTIEDKGKILQNIPLGDA